MPNRPLTSSVSVPQVTFNPGAALADIAQIQTSQEAIAAARQKSMARMRTQQLAQQHANDPEAFLDALSAEFPMEGAALTEKYYSGLKEKALEHKAKIEADKITLDTALQLVQGATPETWGVRRGLAVKLGGEIADQLLPQEYNLDALNGVAQTGRSAAAYLDAQSKATTEFFEGKPRKAAAELFAASTTPEQWKATQEYLSQAGRQGRELVAQFGEFSPEAQANAARAALTVKETEDLGRQATAEQRQGEQFKASEARQAKQFGMSYGLDAARLRVSQAAEARQAKAAAAGGGTEEGGLVDAVIANPSLWDDLTPTVKGKIAPALQAKGFEGFGKMLPPAAVKQIAESDTALDSLKDLRETLKANEQYIGPIAGLQALYPYSEARKAQASIDLVRQRVGKALEGGVLRKEDEEKYKKILANLTDTPSTAIAKVDQLVHSIEQDKKNFINQQRLSGRRVNPDVEQGGGGVEVKAPNGKTYKFATQAQADLFKKRAGIQ